MGREGSAEGYDHYLEDRYGQRGGEDREPDAAQPISHEPQWQENRDDLLKEWEKNSGHQHDDLLAGESDELGLDDGGEQPTSSSARTEEPAEPALQQVNHKRKERSCERDLP